MFVFLNELNFENRGFVSKFKYTTNVSIFVYNIRYVMLLYGINVFNMFPFEFYCNIL